MTNKNAPSQRVLPASHIQRIPVRADRDFELRLAFGVAAACATASAALFGYQIAGYGTSLSLVLISSALSVLWYASLRPGLSSSTRIRGALLAEYIGTVAAVATLGMCAEAMLMLVGFVTLTALHVGARKAWLAFGVALLTIAAVPWLTGAPMVGSQSLRSFDDSLNWVRAGLLGSGVIGLVGGCAALSLRELTRAVDGRTKLVEQLHTEALVRDRAMAQLAEAQERLMHAHKLEAVGRLAGGIAHDFNNTLTVILSYGELLRSRLSKDAKLANLADNIVQAAQQGGDLTQQLLTFTRRQVVKPRTIDVQQVLSSTERALSRLVPKTVRIERSGETDALHVNIDPTQLQQAILNLALNARDAMPNGGNLCLEVSVENVEDSTLPLLPGRYVVIRVRDSGVGMTEDTKSRIFEPFFTTKEPGMGTGLGLSNVLETIHAATGHVTVSSESGKGSLFSIYLPFVEPHISSVESTRPPRKPSWQGKLLVVDDEPQIRQVLQTILASHGFDVLTADSTRAALQILNDQEIDLLCTDMAMPDAPGTRLIDAARELRPRLPIVICSAYGIGEDLSRRVAAGEVSFLAKPFSREQLCDVVFRALSTARLQRAVPPNDAFQAG